MSFPKKGRNIQSRLGKAFPSVDVQAPLGSARFAAIIADALHREFGETHAAIKLVAGFTHANERAVKNWSALSASLKRVLPSSRCRSSHAIASG